MTGHLVSRLITGLVLVPPMGILFSALTPSQGVWEHLVTLLGPLFVNTAWLVLGVGTGVLLLGVSLAGLVAYYSFPGRRFFEWGLMLPLALPAYVLAFVYVGLFDFSGAVPTYLRTTFGLQSFPTIRSLWGVVLVMTLAFYPYVYSLTRNAFTTEGARAMEAATTLGRTTINGFFSVSLPMAYPWIVGGLLLSLMETVTDFGTVSIFNYDTATTAIYKAWYSLFSLSAAAQIASFLMIIIFVVLLVTQRILPGHQPPAGHNESARRPIPLTGARAWFASAYCALVLSAGFFLPVIQLMVWAARVAPDDLDGRYLGFAWHSVLVASIAAIVTCTTAFLISVDGRKNPRTAGVTGSSLATLGYALPGPILAVGLFIPLAWVDRQIVSVTEYLFSWKVGPLLQGTFMGAVFIMVVAYLIRFMAVATGAIGNAMRRIPGSMEESARSLNTGSTHLWWNLYLPVLRGGLFTAATLVFVEVMKEMPLTLMTRPFGWETLAIRIFEMTSEGQWERAALPGIILVLTGLLPIALGIRHSDHARY